MSHRTWKNIYQKTPWDRFGRPNPQVPCWQKRIYFYTIPIFDYVKGFLLTDVGKKLEICKLVTMPELQFESILRERQNKMVNKELQNYFFFVGNNRARKIPWVARAKRSKVLTKFTSVEKSLKLFELQYINVCMCCETR